jgi:hypothetical protein
LPPLLETVTLIGLLVVPVCWAPKFSEEGEAIA